MTSLNNKGALRIKPYRLLDSNEKVLASDKKLLLGSDLLELKEKGSLSFVDEKKLIGLGLGSESNEKGIL